MKFEIKSRKFGKVTFSRPGESYVYCDMGDPNNHGSFGNQICYGGRLAGSTVTFYGDDETAFERLCRNWWRSYLRRV